MIVALFDSDGTLYSAQFGRGLLRYAAEHGRKNKVRLYYASLIPDILLARLFPSAVERFQRTIITRLAWLIQRYNPQQLAAAFKWVAGEYLLPTTRPEILERLQYHLAQDHRVVIVSGMFTPCLEIIGTRLGVTDWVGTQVEYQDGRCTGRILPPVIKGQDKVEQVRRHFKEQGLQVDWDSSFAYGDSFSDRDMLELVGHPTAVHPDSALRMLAHERGWSILEA